ncbi:MAG: cytochrome-c peroxidase [Bacteroidetes bacterium]|nr:MAG: cytochrome-c peroxidase [Bacteroidota bacterium]
MGVLCLLAFRSSDLILFQRPEHFPAPVYNFEHNQLNQAEVELGRYLFYDPLLSADGQISCASCHSPYNAFAHTDHDLSHGINDEIGSRNAPALFNLAWQSSFMWDGAINHLDMQALAPISHPKEMGEDIRNVVDKLNRERFYKELFYGIYKDSLATGERVLKALSQFQLTLVSADSKYDRVKLGMDTFSLQEENGYRLFLKNCNSCHAEPLFSNYQFKKNGLKADSVLKDYGRMMITQNSADSLVFKTPSLRNLSYTYPYMHDGRFKNLYEVLNHYTSLSVKETKLSEELKQKIVLTNHEKTDLVTFLLTLNDRNFVFNPLNKYPNKLRNKN